MKELECKNTSYGSELTSGGPARKIVPCLRTIMFSSAIAGVYAPPAVQLPRTTETCEEKPVFFRPSMMRQMLQEK